MQDYTDVARQMAEGSIVKYVSKDYVVYKRKWLYEHLEQEILLIKSMKYFKPIADGITRLRQYIAEQESSK